MSRSSARLPEIFDAAIALPPSQRAGYLDKVCGDDQELRARVSRLLASHEAVSEVLPEPPTSVSDAQFQTIAGAGATELIGKSLNGYRVMRLIGEGGMGAVYEAQQRQPERTVALKVVRPGCTTRSMRRRFRFESEAFARLRHPGIAQIYEAGTFDLGSGATPYFAMEFIPSARTIIGFVEEERLSIEERVQLFADVCDAVQHGHQQGIIHRDLKPANILVDLAGRPKIIDFGVARSTDSDIAAATLQTNVGELIGTVLYMSPEQIAGDPAGIDSRTDVYALGVVLFELLSGARPYEFDRRSIAEAARIIQDESPRPLSSVQPRLGGDLQTIVGKAMEKSPDRRYQSAAELARDVRRFLCHEPVLAVPPSAFYRARLLVRRNPVVSAAVAVVLLVLVVGGSVTTSAWLQSRAANLVAAAEAARTERALAFVVGLLRAPAPDVRGRDVRVVDALENVEARLEEIVSGDRELEVAIRNVLGEVLFGLGEYAEAADHFKRSAVAAQAVYGERSDETTKAKASLGVAVAHLGDLPQGERLLREAVAVREELGMDRNDDHALVLSQLAAVLEMQQRYDEARQYYEDALARASVDTRARMETLAGLGVVLFRLGSVEEALRRSQEAHALATKELGVGHPRHDRDGQQHRLLSWATR